MPQHNAAITHICNQQDTTGTQRANHYAERQLRSETLRIFGTPIFGITQNRLMAMAVAVFALCVDFDQ